MVDINLLKRRIADSGITIAHIAKEAGMSRETFYNRLENPEFKVSEAQRIGKTLHLTEQEFLQIFFASNVN